MNNKPMSVRAFFIVAILILCLVVCGNIGILHVFLYIPYNIAAPSVILITSVLIIRLIMKG